MESEFPGLHLRFLKVVGVSDLLLHHRGVSRNTFSIYSKVTIILFLTASYLALFLHTYINSNRDFEFVFSLVYFTLPTIVCAIRFVYFLANLKKINTLLEICKPDFLSSKQSNETDKNVILKNGLKNTNSMLYYYTTIVYLNAVFWMVSPIFKFIYHKYFEPSLYVPGSYKILAITYPISIAASPIFELVWIYECITFLIIIEILIFDELIVLAIVSMFGTQLDVLKSNFKAIKLSNSCERGIVNGNILEEQVYQQLIKCIQDHQKILRFSNLLESTFNPDNTLQLTVIVISLLMVCFRMTRMNSLIEYVKNILYFISVISQLLIRCWSSSLLITKSQIVEMNSVDSEWVGRQRKFKYALQMLIMCCQKPIKLTASWGVISMDLETIIGVLQVTYSYYTVLQRVNAQKTLKL